MLEEAIEAAGGVTPVAKELDINPISVREWIDNNRLPPKRVIPLAEMTGWKYTPHMLDPVLYPNERDGLPPEVLL